MIDLARQKCQLDPEKDPPMGVNLAGAPAYMASENYVKNWGAH